jgi:hypothetical protein
MTLVYTVSYVEYFIDCCVVNHVSVYVMLCEIQ